jgi:mannose-1-phosphate guanylyltransferase
MITLIPVILAGGEGKRLAPISSPEAPKQFLRFGKDGESLFASAYKRALMATSSQNLIIVTQETMARQTWREIHDVDRTSKSHVILEPSGRNTAAAIAMAAIHALNHFENPVLWVMPSDHYIEKPFALINAIHESETAAAEGHIVTFGTTPTRNDSNYGHIIPGEKLSLHPNLYNVKFFLEKPEGKRLEWLMQQDNCLWNSGMFMFSAKTILKHLKTRSKLVVNYAQNAYKTGKTSAFGLVADNNSYSKLPALSIDKLVMENNENVVVRQVDIGWSDVGTWHSLRELSQKKDVNFEMLEKFLAQGQSVA